MEIKKSTKRIEVWSYIACDGREFDDEEKCLTYERMLQEDEDRAITESLPQFDYNEPFGDEAFNWYYIRTPQELMAVIRNDLRDEEIEFSKYGSFDEIAKRYPDLTKFPGWFVTIANEDGYGAIHEAKKALRWYEDFVDHVRNEIQEREALMREKETNDRAND